MIKEDIYILFLITADIFTACLFRLRSSLCLFQCGLSWTLYKVSQEHLEKPLVNFSVDLPEDWGMPLGWSLAFVPVLLIIFGFIFHLLWKSRGMPFKMVRELESYSDTKLRIEGLHWVNVSS